MNWQQFVTTSSPLPGEPANTPYEGGADPVYYYSLDPNNNFCLGKYYSTGDIGQTFDSSDPYGTQYGLIFTDNLGRVIVGYSWQASLSLVIMGSNGSKGPSATLATINYGFTFGNTGQTTVSY